MFYDNLSGVPIAWDGVKTCGVSFGETSPWLAVTTTKRKPTSSSAVYLQVRSQPRILNPHFAPFRTP